MKTVACIALHYGRDYLRWVIRGVAQVVDEIHIFYAAHPTFGFSVEGLVCPDSFDDLVTEVASGIADVHAAGGAPKPPFWHYVQASSEEIHRTFMMDLAQSRGADIMVVVDADEVWNPADLEKTIRSVYDAHKAYRWLTRFANFWRSFDWMVDDSFRPVRFVDLRVYPGAGDAYLTEETQPGPIYHFGYAQRAELMRYKMAIHGHKAEFRPNWLETKFFGWQPGDADTHPCVNDLWTPRRTDPATRTVVDQLLHDHPYRKINVDGAIDGTPA